TRPEQQRGPPPRIFFYNKLDAVDPGTVKLLVGWTGEWRLRGPFYVSFGSGADVLSVYRAARLIADADTIFGPVIEWTIGFPVAWSLFGAAFGEYKLTAGVHLSDHISVEAGIWPPMSTLFVVLSPSVVTQPWFDWGRATQPGILLSGSF
ncbi:MAG: hypothetical protein AAF211_15900, partial [Myxococcota bacterium]